MNPGTRVDRFIIERLLGRGGMAEVYAARDTKLGRRVALKRLRSSAAGDATRTVRFLREARFASAFHHPSAVVVYDIFETDGEPYIAMEFVEGRTLRSFIGDASIPAARRIRWLIDAARALGAAHRVGLVHRDVKPHNIMVTDDGRVKVLDFGIASVDRVTNKLVAEESDEDSLASITQTGAIVGTPIYASPEQLGGRPVDGRSDQFSWALTGYELLCGYLPWRRRHAMNVLSQLADNDIPSMSERVAEMTTEPKDPRRSSDPMVHPVIRGVDSRPRSVRHIITPELFEGVPLAVEPVIACAMSREPDERFPTIDDAADALEEHAEPVRSIVAPVRSLRSVALSMRLRPSLRTAPDVTSGPIVSERKPVAAGPLKSPPPPPSASPWTKRSVALPPTPPDTGSSSGAGTPAGATPFTVASTPAVSASMAPSTDATPKEGTLAPPRSTRLDAPAGSPRSRRSARAQGEGAAANHGPTNAGPAAPLTPSPAPRRPWWRRTAVAAAVGSAGLLAAMLGLTRVVDRAAPQAATAPPTKQEITSVSCGRAEVRGQLAASGDLSRAPQILGAAACVRLAVELGTPWTIEPQGPAMRVVVDATSSPVRVTLALAGAESRGEGERPIDAITAAIAPLAASLRAAPPALADWTAEGAGDSARALREARRAGLLLAPDPRADLNRWSAADARSPWPAFLTVAVSIDGDAGAAFARQRAEPLASALPPARASLVRGLLATRAPARTGDTAEGLRSLRRAYVLAPDDAEVAAAFASALFRLGRIDEAMPIAQRLFERGAAVTLPAVVLASDADPDPRWTDERGRLFDSLEAWLPEARAWPARVRHELHAGRIEAAKQSVDLAVALGLPWVARSGDLSRGLIALASLETEKARALARPLVVSPDPAISDAAVRILVQSYLLEGRAIDARTELSRDVERQLAVGNDRLLASRYAWLLSISRRMEQRAPSFIDQDRLRALIERLAAVDDPIAVNLEAELFAAKVIAGDEKPRSAAALLDRAEASANRAAQGDRAAHDAALAAAAPLASLALTAKEQLAWWRALEKAPYAARLPHTFAIGRLCERQDDDAGAESAYREAVRTPIAVDGLDYVTARLRLARLAEERGDDAEAARLREPIARLLASADPDVARRAERLAK